MSRRPVAPPSKPRSGTARTVVLVAVAAVLAGLIIGRGLSNNDSSGSSSDGATGTDASGAAKTTVAKSSKGGTSTTATTATPTSTTAAVNLGAFTAVVLNGNGIAGTAGARTTELGALGVKVAKAADAVRKDYTGSLFYALDAASEPAARLLASKAGIAYSGGYPTANPPAAVDKLGGATIVLLLGKDVANKPITDVSGTPTTAAAAATTAAGATTTVKA